MKEFVAKIRGIDTRNWAVAALGALWISTTFSIALMEIAFVAAVVLWSACRLRSKFSKSGKNRSDF